MPSQNGGCLCGDVRYSVSNDPVVTTICHCHQLSLCPHVLTVAHAKSAVAFEETQSTHACSRSTAEMPLSALLCGRLQAEHVTPSFWPRADDPQPHRGRVLHLKHADCCLAAKLRALARMPVVRSGIASAWPNESTRRPRYASAADL